MTFGQKSRKKYKENHNRAKKAHVNTDDPATCLKDAHYMGSDKGNVAR